MGRLPVIVAATLALAGGNAAAALAEVEQGQGQPPGGPTGSHAQAHVADGKLGDWRGKPTMIAGQTTTSRGEYIYTDWVYDDYGPDLNGRPDMPAFRADLAPTRGDYRYPTGEARYGNNAADLRELRVAVDKTTVHLLIALQTMKAADAAVVQVAIDADRSATTSAPGGRWPAGAGITTKGPEHFVTTWGNAARLAGPGHESVALRSVANTRANAVEVDVPRSALGKLARHPRIWVVTGLNDGHGRFMQQTSGATAVFNAGFRKFEPFPKPGGDPGRFTNSEWSDTRQAAVLATGDISAFSGSFDVALLRAGGSTKPRPVTPGEYVRIFRSEKDYGEGIDLKGGSSPSVNVGGSPAPEFKSRYQPYALYIPKGYDPRRRNVLTLDGHSLDCSHLEYATVSPNQEIQLGDQRRSVLVTPLARGADTWYINAGLVDTIEAWNDARRHYRLDDDRTFITGYSMGGYMTYRLGLLMPDRFVKAAVYVGPPAYQYWPYPAAPIPGDHYTAIGNTNEIVENAFDLPYEINGGNNDELVPISGVQHQVDTFQADGNAYVFYHHSANDHLSFILNDEWSHTRDFLGTARLNRNPVEVRYRRYPAVDQPRNGLRFDRAYWVSGIRVRGNQSDTGNSGRIDAVTHGFGGHLKRPQQELPQPVAGPVSPGVRYQQRQVAGAPIAKANALDVTTANLSGATVDLTRIGLTLRRALKLHVHNDAPLDLVLRGPYGKLSVTGATLTKVGGGVRLHVAAGNRTLTLTPG